jgi:hypothetical protein
MASLTFNKKRSAELYPIKTNFSLTHNCKTLNFSNYGYDTKYNEDYENIKKLDYSKLINKYSGNFFNIRDFKNLDLPDTKNFQQLSEEVINFKTIKKNTLTNDSRTGSILYDDFFNTNLKNNYKNIKKKLPEILIVFFVLILIIIIIYYS